MLWKAGEGMRQAWPPPPAPALGSLAQALPAIPRMSSRSAAGMLPEALTHTADHCAAAWLLTAADMSPRPHLSSLTSLRQCMQQAGLQALAHAQPGYCEQQRAVQQQAEAGSYLASLGV